MFNFIRYCFPTIFSFKTCFNFIFLLLWVLKHSCLDVKFFEKYRSLYWIVFLFILSALPDIVKKIDYTWWSIQNQCNISFISFVWSFRLFHRLINYDLLLNSNTYLTSNLLFETRLITGLNTLIVQTQVLYLCIEE